MSIVDTVANALGGSPGNGEIGGPLYTATNPAVANLLDRHPVVSARLALGDTAVRAHSARHEGAYLGFLEARKRADESKSDEAVAHHDARQVGQPVDAKVAKRLLQSRQAAFDGLKRAERALTEASQLGGNTRFAFEQALNFVGRIPVEGKTIGTLAVPIKLPDKDLNSIVSTQRQVLASLAEEEADIKRAPLPLDDAIAIIRLEGRRRPTSHHHRSHRGRMAAAAEPAQRPEPARHRARRGRRH